MSCRPRAVTSDGTGQTNDLEARSHTNSRLRRRRPCSSRIMSPVFRDYGCGWLCDRTSPIAVVLVPSAAAVSVAAESATGASDVDAATGWASGRAKKKSCTDSLQEITQISEQANVRVYLNLPEILGHWLAILAHRRIIRRSPIHTTVPRRSRHTLTSVICRIRPFRRSSTFVLSAGDRV
jgi:hypothetical protein